MPFTQKSIDKVLEESENKFWNNSDILELRKWLEKDKINHALELITSSFSEYSNKIQEYKEKYSNNERRYSQITKRIPDSFELVAKASSIAVPENVEVKKLIENKKEELNNLILKKQ